MSAETPIMISPAGYIVEIRHDGPPQPGIGSMGDPVVTPLLPGSVIQERGSSYPNSAGQLPISGLSGFQGTLEVYFITGAAGVARTVAMLTDGQLGGIAIGVDASNQPFGLIFDVLGNNIANIGLPVGATPSGISFSVRLVWDSRNALMVVEGSGIAATSATLLPTNPWEHFVPTSLWIGGSDGIVPYPDFNGVVLKIQASNNILLQFEPTHVSGTGIQAQAHLDGSSSISADAQLLAVFTGRLGSPISMPTHLQLGVP